MLLKPEALKVLSGNPQELRNKLHALEDVLEQENLSVMVGKKHNLSQILDAVGVFVEQDTMHFVVGRALWGGVKLITIECAPPNRGKEEELVCDKHLDLQVETRLHSLRKFLQMHATDG